MRLIPDLPARIETQRLVLRPPAPADLAPLVALANDWRVIENTASLPFPYLEEHGRAFLANQASWADKRSYAIAGYGSDAFMGVIGLYFFPDRPAEIGYWLGRPQWRQGYAAEAVDALVTASAAAGLATIRARVLAGNPASVRVLEKSGFAIVEQTTSVVERHLGKPLLILERAR